MLECNMRERQRMESREENNVTFIGGVGGLLYTTVWHQII